MRFLILFAILRLLLAQDPQCPRHYQYLADLDICLNDWTAQVAWSFSLANCRDDGGEFISIHNAFENAVWASIQQHASYPAEDFLLGARVGKNDTWAWSDGTSFDYQHFQTSNDTGDCLAMSAVDGTWKRDNCAADKHKTYYCVTRPVPSLSPPLPTQPSSLNCSSPQFQPLYNCVDGWQYFPETGYQYLVIYNTSFDDGEAYCQSLGAHLVSIHSEAENTFVTRLCCPSSEAYHYESTAAMYVTGGHRRTFDWGPFTWTDGSANDYAGLSCGSDYGPANLVITNVEDVMGCYRYSWVVLEYWRSGKLLAPYGVCKKK